MRTILSIEFNNKKYGIKLHRNVGEKTFGYKRKVFGSFTLEYNFPYFSTKLEDRINKIHKKSIKNFEPDTDQIRLRNKEEYDNLIKEADENNLKFRKMNHNVVIKLTEPEQK
jgi:hypothetical protein